MSDDYITRAQIGLRKARSSTSLSVSKVENVAWHHPGMSVRIDASGDIGFRRVCSAIRGWQNYHMDGRGWSDIAYQVAVDQVGRKYTLRGINIKSGANGNNDVNTRFGAALLVLGPGEEPSAAMMAASKEVLADFRARFHRVPKRPTKHSAVRPAGTECPGKEASRAIDAGKFDAGTATPGGDDMSADDVRDINAYQKVCALQIQANTRQLLEKATKSIMDYQKVCTLQIQENTRQVDATSDKQVADQLSALEKGMQEKLDDLKAAVVPDIPEPGEEPVLAGGN